MANEILNSLLKEYDYKKLKAEIELDNRKENLYNKLPRLKQIEDELNTFALQTAKNILHNDKSSLSSLYEKIDSLKKEKQNILKENNIDFNYLKPKYECEICKDTGYIMTDNYKSEMCSCLKQKLLDISFNKSNVSNLENENFNKFNENLFSDEINIEKYKFNISPRNNIIQIKNKCIEFIDNFENPNYHNLLFVGNTGLR